MLARIAGIKGPVIENDLLARPEVGGDRQEGNLEVLEPAPS